MKQYTLICTLLLMSWHGFSQSTSQEAINRAKMKYTKSLQFNDFAEAKSAIYDLLVLEPNNYAYLDSLAFMYYEFRQYASAALVSKEALQYNSQNQVILQISAQSLSKLGAVEQALAAFQKLYNITDDAYVLYEMTMKQYDLEKLDEAWINTELLMGKPLVSNSKVIVKDKEGNDVNVPFKAVVYNLQGLIKKAQGDKEGAKKYFNNAVQLAPSYALAKENLNTTN